MFITFKQWLHFYFFFFKQKTAYEMLRSLVGSEMCIRDRNNAALGEQWDFANTSDIRDNDFAKKVIDCNVIGTINLTEQLLPYLADDGKIVIVSSDLGKLSYQGQRIQRALSKECSRQDIIDLVEDYLSSCQQKDLNGWSIQSYHASKALINAYVRHVLSKLVKETQQAIAVHPGWCKSDMGGSNAPKSAEDGANAILYCVYGIPFGKEAGANGQFFIENKAVSYN
eukprot:TRINITY_DN300_c0_g1_i2.p1 TRINITY_DN300_c0_g1~~TRINITY_DN300_c0_g1_i2.p1  ORF type:complete len:226 (+),score=44.65 TRINITY_DN300_c0_g1_i2:22-699(+)